MRLHPSDYADYVEHPRFGRSPRFSGFDPNPNAEDVHLHWINGPHSPQFDDAHLDEMERILGWRPTIHDCGTLMIPGTAVKADLSRQSRATVPVTHYYDLDKHCLDCGRRFIFFAEEQKHWYEELQLPLEADCLRCVQCRKRLQSIARQRKRYEELCHVPNRTSDENLEMAACCLTLIEEAVFTPRKMEQVRMLLNRIPDSEHPMQEFQNLTTRLQKLKDR